MSSGIMVKKEFLFVLALVLLPLVFYLPSLGIFFLSDSADLLKRVADYGFADIFLTKFATAYRPLSFAFTKILFVSFGFQYESYHVFAILLHIANVLLFFLVANRILKNTVLSFLSAFFFAVFYMNYEPIIWIAAISHLFKALFLLLSLFFFLGYLEKKTKSSQGHIAYIASIAFFSIATFLEEGSAFLLPLLALTELFLFADARKFFGNFFSLKLQFVFWKKYFPFFAALAAYGVLFVSIGAGAEIAFSTFWAILFFKDIIAFLLVPVPLIRDFFLLQPGADILPFAISSIIFFVLFAALNFFVFFRWKNNNAARFGLLFMYASMVPIIIHGGMGARYFYLPSMGAAIFLATALFSALQYFFKAFIKASSARAERFSFAALSLLLVAFSLYSFSYVQDRISEWNNASNIFVSGLSEIKNSFPDGSGGKKVFLVNNLDRIGGNFEWDAAPVLRYGIPSGLWILSGGRREPPKIFYDINTATLAASLSDKNTVILFFDKETNRYRKAIGISFGENVLKNNGFEQGNSGWQPGIIADSSKKFSGDFSGKISNDSGLLKQVFSEKILVDGNLADYYYFSVSVFSDAANGAQVLFFWWNSDSNALYPGKKGKDFDATDYFIGEKNSWVFLESVLQLPLGARAIGLRLSVLGNGSAWFDELQMKKLSVDFGDG